MLFPERKAQSVLSVVLVLVFCLLSILPVSAQSNNSADSPNAGTKVFLPIAIDPGAPLDASDAEGVDADNVASASVNLSAIDVASSTDTQGLIYTSPFSSLSTETAEVGDVSAAATNVVCLVSGFQGNINPLSNAFWGPRSTTQCKYIDLQLAAGSNKVWVRVDYYKSKGTVKYGKWYYITTTAVYRILKNPKAGTVFYLEFYNPFTFTSYIQGAVRY